MNNLVKPIFHIYLKQSFKNILIITLTLLIEQFLIFTSIIKTFETIYLNSGATENQMFKFFQSINLLELIKSTLDCSYKDQKNNSICRSTGEWIVVQIVLTVIILLFILLIFMRNKMDQNQKNDLIVDKVNDKNIFLCMFNFSIQFLFYLLEITIHFLTPMIFYLNFNELISLICLINPSNTINSLGQTITNRLGINDILICLLSILLLIFYFYVYFSLKRSINLIIQFNKDLSTPYDYLFSVKYDMVNFLLKIIIAWDFALKTNKFLSSQTIYFTEILLHSIMVLFNLYILITIFFSKKFLFLSNFKSNMIRIFLNLNVFFNCVFIYFFNQTYFQTNFITYFSLFLSFISSLFISFQIKERNFFAIYKSNNYIQQMIFILNIKINSTSHEVLSEISSIMFFHKLNCSNFRFCLICQYESYDIKIFLTKIFEQSKISIKNKNAFNTINFTKNDLDAFELIKIVIAEIFNKNRIIKLFYKSRRIVEKYEIIKRFNNNYYNLIIYTDYLKKFITKNQVMKYKIINCYQNTGEEINKTIEVLEYIVLNMNSAEKHLFTKSQELFELKESISNNLIFLTQNHNCICDNYSLILYRFIYKNLFNVELGDFTNHFDFEDNKELIEYTYNSEKMIQIKLDFSNNRLKILRIGKDMINYRDKTLDYLIPSEFKEYFIEELIRKIKNSDNCEDSQTFEFVIIDNENNLKSMKIKFSILVSLKLDEVILIGQYDILTENLILLRKNNQRILNEEENIIEKEVKIFANDENLFENINEIREESEEENQINEEEDTPKFQQKNKKEKKTKKEKKGEKTNKSNKNNKKKSTNDNEKNELKKKQTELTADLFEKSNSFMINFSSNLQEIFLLKAIWLPKILQKFSISFDGMFQKAKSFDLRTENKRNKIYGRLDYQRFYAIYQSILSYLEEEMNSDGIRENLKKFKKFVKKSHSEIYRFDFLYEIEIKTLDRMYLLFKIKNVTNDESKDETSGLKSSLLEEEDDSKISNQNQRDLDRIGEKLQNQNRDNLSVSSSSTSISSKNDMLMRFDSSRKTINKNEMNMNKFTIFSFIFCVFLILFCLVFLVVGLVNNNIIRKLYIIRNDYNDFRYLFYNTNINIFYLSDINRNTQANEGIQANKENAYVTRFKSNNKIKINISKYIINELEIKLNIIRESYNVLQTNIYKSEYKDSLDAIFKVKTTFLQIYTSGNTYNLLTKEIFFFETMNIFFNHGKVIVENINLKKHIYLNLINIKGVKIVFNEYNKENNSELKKIQMKIYELIINYLNFHKNFEEIGKLMNNLFKEALDSVFNTTYLLSFILMGLHFVLIMGGVFLIFFLNRILKQNSRIIAKFSNEENIKYMKEKLKSIKVLNMLFIKNPKTLVQNLNKSSSEYMKKLSKDAQKKSKYKKFNNKKINQIQSNNEERLEILGMNNAEEEAQQNSFSNKNFFDNFKILLPFMKLLSLISLFFYVYSIIFYFVFLNSYYDFNRTADFGNKNIILDSEMMNNINIFNTMIFLNKTEMDVAYELTGERKEVMNNMFFLALEHRLDVIRFKDQSSRFETFELFEKKLMNCSFLYESVNDPIIEKMMEKVEDNSILLEELKKICISFPFMRTNYIDNIFQETVYKSVNVYNSYMKGDKDVDGLIKSYNNEVLFEIFLTFTFIFRPIRKFAKDYIYENVVFASSDDFLLMTIIYLILNIFVDIFIFFAISKLIVKKISDINKHITNMINCLNFKYSNNH